MIDQAPLSSRREIGPVRTVLATVLVLATASLGACKSTAAKLVRAPDSEVPGIFYDDPALFEEELRIAPRPVPDAAIELTKSQEHFRGSPYNDPAKLCTVAYGHLIVKNPCGKSEYELYPHPLTEAQGTDLLAHDMQLAEIIVGRGVTRELTDDQYGALCDFTFNVGGQNFLNSRLRKLVDSGDLAQIPAEFRRWKRAGSRVLDGLVKRRELEIRLFFQGIEMPRELAPEEPTRPDIDVITGRNVR